MSQGRGLWHVTGSITAQETREITQVYNQGQAALQSAVNLITSLCPGYDVIEMGTYVIGSKFMANNDKMIQVAL